MRSITIIEQDLSNARRDQRFCVTPTVKRTATIAVNRFEAERQNALDAIVVAAAAKRDATPAMADPNAERIAALEAEIAALKVAATPTLKPVKATTIKPVKVDVQPPLKGTVMMPLDDDGIDNLLDSLDGTFAPMGERGDGSILPTQRQMDRINELADALDFNGIKGVNADVTRTMASDAIRALKVTVDAS